MYFVIFIDDFSRKVWVYFMRHKSEMFAKFKLWKAEVENQIGKKVKCLRKNNGTEYINDEFRDFCEQHDIKRHFTVCKTPQQNGVMERMNRSIAERARCLRLNAGLTKIFWADAVSMACYFINRSLRAALDGNVAEEMWTDNEVDYSSLRVFGCPAYVHIPSEEWSKLDPKSRQCVFLIYGKGVKDYKFWDPTANKAVISRDMVFDENSMLNSTQGKEQ
jgi:transposase InsO family protein